MFAVGLFAARRWPRSCSTSASAVDRRPRAVRAARARRRPDRDVVGPRPARRRQRARHSSPRVVVVAVGATWPGRSPCWRWPSSSPAGSGSSPRRPRSRPTGADAASGPAAPAGCRPPGGCAVAALFGLMAATQSLFVTFGPWLEDDFGVGAAGLAAVTFGIGGVELVASLTSAARTDRWGKERSVIAGAGVMVPAGLALAVARRPDRAGPPAARHVHLRLRVLDRLDDPDRWRPRARRTGARPRHDDRLRDARAGRHRDPGHAALRALRPDRRRP